MRTWGVNNNRQYILAAVTLVAAIYFLVQARSAGIGALLPALLLLAASVAIPFFVVLRIETGSDGITFRYLPPRRARQIAWREIRGIRSLKSGSGDWYQLQLRAGQGPSIPPGPQQLELVEHVAIAAGLKKGSRSPKGQG